MIEIFVMNKLNVLCICRRGEAENNIPIGSLSYKMCILLITILQKELALQSKYKPSQPAFTCSMSTMKAPKQ